MPLGLNPPGLLVVIALSLGSAEPARSERCTGGAERTVFGLWGTVPAADSRLDAATRKVNLSPPSTTRYIRLLIEAEAAGAPGWTLVIRDINQHVLQILGAQDIEAEGDILTRRMATNALQLELVGPENALPKLLLRQQIVMPFAVEGQPYYSRKTPEVDDWEALYGMPMSTKRKWGDNVAFLMIGLNEGSQPATCSGIALPPDLLLTAWHCGPRLNGAGDSIVSAFWSQSICDRTLIDLSWDDDEVSREFICREVLARSRDLDYVLLRVHSIDGSPAIGPVPINLRRDAITASIIHHPAASQKVISADCQILDWALSSGTDQTPGAGFAHNCDSESGSSGAPVFDSKGAVIGMHHRGFEKVPQTGSCDNRNKAIWLDAILDDLNRKIEAGEDKVTEADSMAIKAFVVP